MPREAVAVQLVSQLAEGFPVFEVAGREQSVAHLLVFVQLVAVAQAPTARAESLRVGCPEVLLEELLKPSDLLFT